MKGVKYYVKSIIINHKQVLEEVFVVYCCYYVVSTLMIASYVQMHVHETVASH